MIVERVRRGKNKSVLMIHWTVITEDGYPVASEHNQFWSGHRVRFSLSSVFKLLTVGLWTLKHKHLSSQSTVL